MVLSLTGGDHIANNNADVNADVVAVGAYGTDTINFNIAGTGVHTM
jgi:hypothetical protein